MLSKELKKLFKEKFLENFEPLGFKYKKNKFTRIINGQIIQDIKLECARVGTMFTVSIANTPFLDETLSKSAGKIIPDYRIYLFMKCKSDKFWYYRNSIEIDNSINSIIVVLKENVIPQLENTKDYYSWLEFHKIIDRKQYNSTVPISDTALKVMLRLAEYDLLNNSLGEKIKILRNQYDDFLAYIKQMTKDGKSGKTEGEYRKKEQIQKETEILKLEDLKKQIVAGEGNKLRENILILENNIIETMKKEYSTIFDTNKCD